MFDDSKKQLNDVTFRDIGLDVFLFPGSSPQCQMPRVDEIT